MPGSPEKDRAWGGVATHLRNSREAILSRWRDLVRQDSRLPEQRLKFSDAQLEDHLPGLLDQIVKALDGEPVSDDSIREAGVRHGSARRAQGYSITQVIWEFAVFRKLLRHELEHAAANLRPQQSFHIREQIMALTDLSELGSVERYVDESRQERDAAREELTKANRQRDLFLLVLSHELRNPLAAVRMALQVINAAHSSLSARQRAMEILERQTKYQARLIDDLLDMNRISQGRIELKGEPTDIRRLVTNAIDTYSRAIEAKSIAFRFDYPDEQILVFADPVRIEQVIANLITNSLKFTKTSGSIEVHIRREDANAVISVRDDGAGIEPSRLDRVFELFFREPEREGEAALDVGLWLAKQIIELHGGTIEARSEGIEKGTEVIVRLPLMANQAAEGAAKKVLLVEDDPDQRELLLLALAEIDADIVGAKDGADALAMARGRRFDICILDLNLPDISGYDLIGRLREIQDNHPLMVALTGFGRPEDAARVKSVGFQHHLVKPVELDQLKRIIAETPASR
jgi:signal transduction histidine kinase/ActR/RegA family two-component response regulator